MGQVSPRSRARLEVKELKEKETFNSYVKERGQREDKVKNQKISMILNKLQSNETIALGKSAFQPPTKLLQQLDLSKKPSIK